jgi:hypothetical protein
MKKPIHSLVLTCRALGAHAAYLPRRGTVDAGSMLRFRMDDTISGELSAASAEYIVKDKSDELSRQDDQINAERSKVIIDRFSDKTSGLFQANGALDRCLSGAKDRTPGFPEAFITMEWHLPNLITWECRRANMTHLLPGIGNFKQGSASRAALPDDVDIREDVQVFVFYPGTSRHDHLSIHSQLDAEIKLWARAARQTGHIHPPVFAEINGEI